MSEHSSCWTVCIKTGIFLSFELCTKRKWLSQWGGPCLQILSRRRLLLPVQSFALKTWRKTRFSKPFISYKEHPCTTIHPCAILYIHVLTFVDPMLRFQFNVNIFWVVIPVKKYFIIAYFQLVILLEVVEAPSLETFKTRLDRALSNLI